jgi:predicted TPR repeat methyltransferase
MLDLGCGTGLSGAAFRAHVQHLAGVDLSAAMVERARAKAIYDRLAVADIVSLLAHEEAAAHDLVLAADVLVYVNDLAPIMAAVSRVLAPGGMLAFTVESHPGEGVGLKPTLRYGHGAGHVQAALAAGGMSVSLLSETSVRSENGEPVGGLVVVASTAPGLPARSGA